MITIVLQIDAGTTHCIACQHLGWSYGFGFPICRIHQVKLLLDDEFRVKRSKECLAAEKAAERHNGWKK